MDHRRVLVVDDDPTIRKMLTGVFRQRALTVDEAADGEAAIGLLRDNSYSVVLLDLLMPQTNGFQVLDALKIEGNVAPVVLVVTGAASDIVEQLDAKRVHGIIRKPFDPEEVASIVVACSDIRARNAFGTMAIALASANLIAWLSR